MCFYFLIHYFCVLLGTLLLSTYIFLNKRKIDRYNMIFEGFYGLLVIHIELSEFSDLGSARFRPKVSKRMDF